MLRPNWGSYGSYSTYSVGSTFKHFRALRKPLVDKKDLPRVFFAGEHTSLEYPNTVHGAYLSGLEAANNILDEISL